MRILFAFLNIVVSSGIAGTLAYLAQPSDGVFEAPYYIIFIGMWIGLLFLGWKLSQHLLKR